MSSVGVSVIAQRLARHRKGDLIELARESGYMFDESVLAKTLQKNIASQLAEHLFHNSHTLAENDMFAKFYMPPMSPMKKSTPLFSSPPGGRVSRRLAAKRSSIDPSVSGSIKQEDEDQENEDRSVSGSEILVEEQLEFDSRLSTPTPQTPSPSSNRVVSAKHAAAVPSAVVTDPLEKPSQDFRSCIADLWTRIGIKDNRHYLRDVLSSTVAIDGLLLFTEVVGLLRQTVPRDHLLITPAMPALHLDERRIDSPNVFTFFTAQFWTITSVWAMSSLIGPLFVAYFINLTSQAKTPAARQFDPLVFNVVKALFAWTVYARGFRFGFLPDASVATVNESFPGGWEYVFVGSLVGAVSSLYEAVLQR